MNDQSFIGSSRLNSTDPVHLIALLVSESSSVYASLGSQRERWDLAGVDQFPIVDLIISRTSLREAVADVLSRLEFVVAVTILRFDVEQRATIVGRRRPWRGVRP